MSSPRALIQVLITGTQIFGKAFIAAGRQAYKNAQHRPQGGSSSDAAGVSHATSGSITDRLTREHKMTLDEARLVLNVRKEDTMEVILKKYEHLFKANSPSPPPEQPAAARAKSSYYSHYLQSKVVRAKERIEAEVEASLPEAESSRTPASQSQSTPHTSSQSENAHPPPSS